MAPEPPGDTTRTTIARGEPDAAGWRDLARRGGEPRLQDVPSGEVLACLWHLSDLHVCDAESPAASSTSTATAIRTPPFREELGDIGTYRPQEAFTVQVATTMVRTVNGWTHGRRRGRRSTPSC